MDFKSTALSLCGGILVANMIDIISPDNELRKLVKLALKAFLILIIISPFIKGNLDMMGQMRGVETGSYSYSESEKKLTDGLKNGLEDSLRTKILHEIQIPDAEINFFYNNLDDGSISMYRLSADIPDETEDLDSVKSAIENLTGLEVTVNSKY